jgi:beta-carotene 15,15'-dioxygenase
MYRDLMSSFRTETAFFLTAALLALLATRANTFTAEPSATMVLLLSFAVALVGLPHGGLDGWLARRSGLARGARALVFFHLAYVLAAAAVVILWSWQPTLTLFAFIAISAWHFAGDWAALSSTKRALVGVALLGLPAWQWEEAVSPVFEVLAGDGGLQLAHALSVLGLAFVLVMLTAIWQFRRQPAAALELSGLTALALLTPPLLFFAVYFCALHSPRQLRASLATVERPQRRRLLLLAAVYATLATVLVLAAGFSVMTEGHHPLAWLRRLDADQGLQLLFIGLAALTVPHMGVTWLAARHTGTRS